MYPRWLPHPASIAVAVVAGAAFGVIEARRDERERRNTEVWDEATVFDTVGSNGSGPTSTDPADRPAADSDLPV
jgi:hypothetical protein